MAECDGCVVVFLCVISRALFTCAGRAGTGRFLGLTYSAVGKVGYW